MQILTGLLPTIEMYTDYHQVYHQALNCIQTITGLPPSTELYIQIITGLPPSIELYTAITGLPPIQLYTIIG